ncbi:hypothetical protein NM688_g6064 [Phlebia brevispora]|uniref:Uncharacterized protein n=1 Tax=Phlebia brevispora TaxID=194682 RepID=A0ACC1SKB8_9APHY|nr:hypothetical protein NM688_g6064 [Phlebia brevispora]
MSAIYSSWPAQQAAYTVFSGLGFIVAYIPLYWHLEAWNVGSVLWIFWSGTGCLIQFINAIVWRNNVVNGAPVWCDIGGGYDTVFHGLTLRHMDNLVTRFIHVQPIGIVVASALINYRLYRIAQMSKVFTTRADRRHAGIIDLVIGLGVPAIFMGLYWFVQGHRFDIVEGIGCLPTTPNTTVLLYTFAIWPLIILMISGSFGGEYKPTLSLPSFSLQPRLHPVITIRSFLMHRRDTEFLGSQTTSLTSYRYFRLMLFASLDVAFLLPLDAYFLYLGLQQPFYPWRGLEDLHFQFSFVGQFPVFAWRSSQISIYQIMLIPCTTIAASFTFFAFFGLAKESRVHYREAFDSFTKIFVRSGRRSTDEYSDSIEVKRERKGRGISHLSMPSFVQRVRANRSRQNSTSSTLSTIITLEGHYDEVDSSGDSIYNEKSLPPLPAEDGQHAPAYPPGLSPIPASHPRESRQYSYHSMTSPNYFPPEHTFDGPKSVCLTSIGSMV